MFLAPVEWASTCAYDSRQADGQRGVASDQRRCASPTASRLTIHGIMQVNKKVFAGGARLSRAESAASTTRCTAADPVNPIQVMLAWGTRTLDLSASPAGVGALNLS
jgi:hypothetical protein